MTDLQMGLSMVALLLFLLGMRVPIGISLIFTSFVGLVGVMGWETSFRSLGGMPYQFSASWSLSSIPMFLLMGYLAFHSRLTSGLFEAARIWTSWLPGGLAIAAVMGSSGFAAICGSSVACAAAMGRISVPEMTARGYDPRLATGTVAVAGTIGALIPPSILLILYGVMAEVSITKLFMGGLGIGLLSALAYCIVIIVRVKISPELAPASVDHYTMRDRLMALKDIWPMLAIAIGVFGGMFLGVFTPTEAGAFGAFFVFLLALLTRSLTWDSFKQAMIETILTTTTLMIIGIGASMFARLLVMSGVDMAISDVMGLFYSGPFTLILVIIVIYLILGMFLEPIGAMMLTLPIMLPLIQAEGLSPIWFGIFLAKLLEVGMVTPPVGMNVFVVKSVVGNLVSLGGIFRGVIWFIVIDILLLLLIYWLPELVMYLPVTFG